MHTHLLSELAILAKAEKLNIALDEDAAAITSTKASSTTPSLGSLFGINSQLSREFLSQLGELAKLAKAEEFGAVGEDMDDLPKKREKFLTMETKQSLRIMRDMVLVGLFSLFSGR
jgi:hypothetical protein